MQLRVCSDEIAATALHDSLNDLRLRYPGVGVTDIEGLTENCGQDAPKSSQRLGVRGPRRPGSDDLADRRQIQTHHAIFEEEDALTVQQMGRHGTD